MPSRKGDQVPVFSAEVRFCHPQGADIVTSDADLRDLPRVTYIPRGA